MELQYLNPFPSHLYSSTFRLGEVLKFHHQNLKPKPYVSKKLTTMLSMKLSISAFELQQFW